MIVENLNLSIEGRPILKNINLTFPVNRITCIVGPSGCGKSTLLKCLNRLIDNVDDTSISGRIMIGDQDIISAPYRDLIELRRRIGLVPSLPASDVHIRQCGLRLQDSRNAYEEEGACRGRGAISHRGRTLGRGQGQASEFRTETVDRPAAEALPGPQPGCRA